MNKKNFALLFLLSVAFLVSAQNFDQYFTNKACRVDFHFCGNNHQTEVFFDQVKQEPFWGGRQRHLDDDMNLGDFRFEVIDSASQQVIYRDGFNALFSEWQSTPEAAHVSKDFEQVVQFPYPKQTVVVAVEKRTDFFSWKELSRMIVNPTDLLIDKTLPQTYPVKIIAKHAPTDQAVDIAVVAEGYMADEQAKFYADAQKLLENLLTHEPFKSNAGKINVYAIASVSQDSGVSVPQDSVWKNTVVGSHFYTFYEPRYLTTSNIKKIRDIAALVPYDAIYVLANTSRYGGGGFYNFYTLSTVDNKYSTQVEVHEFGHGFAGLGDEYFYDHDALSDFYDLSKEPWEPNLTTLKYFDKKWRSMLNDSVPVPTPDTEAYKNTVGVFEGGGYMSKGMYRPYEDCRMRTNAYPSFCPVCQAAIEKRIRLLTE